MEITLVKDVLVTFTNDVDDKICKLQSVAKSVLLKINNVPRSHIKQRLQFKIDTMFIYGNPTSM